MRVALVSEHASPLAALGGVDAGGQNVHVAALATALVAAGHDVVVHTRRDDPALPDEVAVQPQLTVHHVTAGPAESIPKDELLPLMPGFAAELRRVWSSWLPDVVHSHFWMSGVAALDAAQPLQLPVVHTFHALGVVKRRHLGDRDPSPAGRLDEERRLVAECDHVVATCSDEVFELRRMGAERSRLSVVPCGVDLDQFTVRGPTLPRGERRRLVVVGRLVERKGVETAIRSLVDLPDVELVVAGGPSAADLADDEEAQRLMSVAESCGVGARVVFLGQTARGEVAALLRSADAALCVPWYEPFGIVPLEAMACGTPVVASAVGGLTDTVVHGVTGLHVPPREPAALADAVRTLLDDEPFRRRLARAGAARARRRYGWATVAASTVDVYRRLGAGQRSATKVGAGRS